MGEKMDERMNEMNPTNEGMNLFKSECQMLLQLRAMRTNLLSSI